VIALTGCGSRKPPPPYPSASPDSGLRLGETSFDRTRALGSDAFSVPVSGAAKGTSVSVAVRGAGARSAVAGPVTVKVTGDDSVVRVPLTEAGRQAVASCSSAPATVELRSSSGAELDSSKVRASDSGPPCGRFFGPDAPWNQELPDDAPLDPGSRARVAALRTEIEREVAAHFGPDINVGDYSTRVYTVPRDQPRVDVALPPEKAPFQEPFRSVPLPDDAKPAAGRDRHLVLWQPATDTMWEFFGLARQGGSWHAEWGGRIERVSRSDGVFAPGPGGVKYGATATGLALAGGLITPGDLRRGRIDHALAFAIPKAMAGRFALPAQRTDGLDRAPGAIPEGARFRLDPKLDLDRLQLPPLSRMIAEALQRYGMILRDQSGVVTFYGQIPNSTGYPDLARAKEGQISGQLLSKLPWDRMQLLRMDLH
jgi:hypothetical protein